MFGVLPARAPCSYPWSEGRDGRVSDEFYDSKYVEYKNRLDDLAERIALHNKAEIGYYEFGRKILELAKTAGKLFEQATPGEKRELLQFLLSNPTIKDGKPDFALKQPFFSIAKHSSVDECSAWQGLVTSVRTIILI